MGHRAAPAPFYSRPGNGTLGPHLRSLRASPSTIKNRTLAAKAVVCTVQPVGRAVHHINSYPYGNTGRGVCPHQTVHMPGVSGKEDHMATNKLVLNREAEFSFEKDGEIFKRGDVLRSKHVVLDVTSGEILLRNSECREVSIPNTPQGRVCELVLRDTHGTHVFASGYTQVTLDFDGEEPVIDCQLSGRWYTLPPRYLDMVLRFVEEDAYGDEHVYADFESWALHLVLKKVIESLENRGIIEGQTKSFDAWRDLCINVDGAPVEIVKASDAEHGKVARALDMATKAREAEARCPATS